MLKQLSKFIFSGLFYLYNFRLQDYFSTHGNPIYRKIPNKISRNITCFTHTCLGVCLSGYYQVSYSPTTFFLMSTVSSGYFLFDIWYNIKYDSRTISNLIYIYHHLVALFILNKSSEYQIYKILFWAEISNIPMYIVYHYMKTEPDSLKLEIWKQIQKYTYLIARIPFLGYYSYQIYLITDEKIAFYLCFPIYLLGIIWTYILFSSK